MLVVSAGPKPGESRETEEKTQRTKACDRRDRDWTMWPQPRTLIRGGERDPPGMFVLYSCRSKCLFFKLPLGDPCGHPGTHEAGPHGDGSTWLTCPSGACRRHLGPQISRIKAMMTDERPYGHSPPIFPGGFEVSFSALEHEDTLGLWFSRYHCTASGGAIVNRSGCSGCQLKTLPHFLRLWVLACLAGLVTFSELY